MPVASVDEALARLAQDAFDLVLADELMPMRGGLDLLKALRSDARYARLPFILMSLFGAEHDTADRDHRPDAVGLKPIRAALLANLVDQVLTGKTPHAPNIKTAAQTLSTFRGNKILLVEDNPVNQRVGAANTAESGGRGDHCEQRRRSLGAHCRDQALMPC